MQGYREVVFKEPYGISERREGCEVVGVVKARLPRCGGKL